MADRIVVSDRIRPYEEIMCRHQFQQCVSYSVWTSHLLPGGTLAIHDVFPNPEDGGRPPYEIYKLALSGGLFEDVAAVKSLRLLRRM